MIRYMDVSAIQRQLSIEGDTIQERTKEYIGKRSIPNLELVSYNCLLAGLQLLW